MKNITKIILILLSFVMIVTAFASCDKKDTPEVEGTASERYVAAFVSAAGESNDLSSIATSVIKSKVLKYSMQQSEAKPGYLLGFRCKDVSDFTEAVCITTKTSSTPFIAYIFRTENAAALSEQLESNIDVGFQICTVADEYAVSTVNDLVFVVICPSK